jgi:hypothetical protein
MGRERALRAINLEETDRIPSVEILDHPEYIRKVSGIDPFEFPLEATAEAVRQLDIDWVIDLPDRSLRFDTDESAKDLGGGRKVTEWGVAGSAWDEAVDFHSPEDVLAYRPLEDTTARVHVVTREYQEERMTSARAHRKVVGDSALLSGLYYTTLFQYGIMGFGWEHFLVAAALEPETYSTILEQFADISERNLKEWVKDDCPVFLFHDDIAMTRGLVFPKEWYLKEILPRYDRILEPVRDSGKKMIFVSDGYYMDLIDELMALGIDGVLIDNSNDLESILTRYGKDKVVIGNVNTLTLTTGTHDEISAEIRRCGDIGRDYPGFFFRAAGDLPHNIPVENMELYFDLKREYTR